jgi:ubiquinone biosynthesis protein COQ9
MSIEQKRRDLLQATLPHVPFDGWTAAAIMAGARNRALSAAEVANAFPGGAIEMIELMSLEADQHMLEALEHEDFANMKVRARVAIAVRRRLELYAADREAVRRALAMLALPQNSVLALRLLYRTVDAIWYAAGDTATDFNFYTKRALLAGVYAATVLAWLNDRSPGLEETWRFLDRRINDAMRLPRVAQRFTTPLRWLPNPVYLLRQASRDSRGARTMRSRPLS